MRIVFKILLFPVVFVLSMLVWFCRAICWFSSGVLSLTSWLLSPFGLPLAAEWIIDRVENVKDAIAAI